MYVFCYEAVRLDVIAADAGFALRCRDPKTQLNKFITELIQWVLKLQQAAAPHPLTTLVHNFLAGHSLVLRVAGGH